MERVLQKRNLYRTCAIGLLTACLCFISPPLFSSPRAQKSSVGDARLTASESVSAIPARILALTNRERIRRGLFPLRRQSNLENSARWLARDMASKNYFEHTDSLNRNIETRFPAFSYSDYRVIGENIAAGQISEEQVVAGWMRSPGHRENILRPEFRELGVGYIKAPKGKYRTYWVQDFGMRPDAAGIVIGDGGGRTDTRKVTLWIDLPAPAEQMRILVDSKPQGPWIAYRSHSTLILPDKPGKHRIEVEVGSSENSRRFTDVIVLTAASPTVSN